MKASNKIFAVVIGVLTVLFVGANIILASGSG